jgi:hypothetical protein
MMQIDEVNFFSAQDDGQGIIDPISYLSKIPQFPRDPDPKYIPPEKEIEILKWIFPMSIFKEFKQDTDVNLFPYNLPFRISDLNLSISTLRTPG